MNKAKMSWPVLVVLVALVIWLKYNESSADPADTRTGSSEATTEYEDRNDAGSDTKSSRSGDSSPARTSRDDRSRRESTASRKKTSRSSRESSSSKAASQEDPVKNAAALAKIEDAYKNKRNKVMVGIWGEVVKILPDDNEGSRHQKFLFKISRRLTLKVAHNIDLAPRVPTREGDRLFIRGQYEFDRRGGVLHWTHHDPRGRHPGGWIELDGKRYE